MIKAILFDLDGVLVDTLEIHRAALNSALTKLAGDAYIIPDNSYDSLPTRKKLERLTIEKGLSKDLHDEIFKLKQETTLELLKDLPAGKDNTCIVPLLKWLGYKTAVCSNAITDTIITCLSNYDRKLRTKPIDCVDLIVSNEHVINSKPAPDMYNSAINFFKLTPRECLVIEDSDRGVAAGKAAGCPVLKVANIKSASVKNIMGIIKYLEKNEDLSNRVEERRPF